jgi:hypothetical protein
LGRLRHNAADYGAFYLILRDKFPEPVRIGHTFGGYGYALDQAFVPEHPKRDISIAYINGQ